MEAPINPCPLKFDIVVCGSRKATSLPRFAIQNNFTGRVVLKARNPTCVRERLIVITVAGLPPDIGQFREPRESRPSHYTI